MYHDYVLDDEHPIIEVESRHPSMIDIYVYRAETASGEIYEQHNNCLVRFAWIPGRTPFGDYEKYINVEYQDVDSKFKVIRASNMKRIQCKYSVDKQYDDEWSSILEKRVDDLENEIVKLKRLIRTEWSSVSSKADYVWQIRSTGFLLIDTYVLYNLDTLVDLLL